jgi:hypothetical protein
LKALTLEISSRSLVSKGELEFSAAMVAALEFALGAVEIEMHSLNATATKDITSAFFSIFAGYTLAAGQFTTIKFDVIAFCFYRAAVKTYQGCAHLIIQCVSISTRALAISLFSNRKASPGTFADFIKI